MFVIILNTRIERVLGGRGGTYLNQYSMLALHTFIYCKYPLGIGSLLSLKEAGISNYQGVRVRASSGVKQRACLTHIYQADRYLCWRGQDPSPKETRLKDLVVGIHGHGVAIA